MNNKIAIYPGTFDPITFGHIDVIKKGATKLIRPYPALQKLIIPMNVTPKFKVSEVVGMSW